MVNACKVEEVGLEASRGWQREASGQLTASVGGPLLSELDEALVPLLDSQSGPYAARVFCDRPTSLELQLESTLFRVLILRRLRLLLPVAAVQLPADAAGI